VTSGYDPAAVGSFGRRVVGVLVLALVGSQVGHLLVYELEFGRLAPTVESTGPHAYFPALAGTAVALCGLALLMAALLLGATKLVVAKSMRQRVVRQPLLDLLPALFTLQLAIFIGQETIEALAAGAPVQPDLVLLGASGQLPVAAVVAVAISLVSARVESALRSLRLMVARPLRRLQLAPVSVPPAVVASLPLAQVTAGPQPGRGPPRR
jgi:hypothetical protein